MEHWKSPKNKTYQRNMNTRLFVGQVLDWNIFEIYLKIPSVVRSLKGIHVIQNPVLYGSSPRDVP
jgi:hypothetical protein